jgi:hypothetical protein
MVLHVLPLSSFSLAHQIGTELRDVLRQNLTPLGAGGWNSRYNIDGFLTFGGDAGQHQDSYCQFFRSGAIESVYADLVRRREGHPVLPSVAYERYVIEALTRYLRALVELGVPPPAVVTLSMLGVRGARMAVGEAWWYGDPLPIDRDDLLLPDVMIEDYGVNLPTILRPIFDAVWNAAGFARSFNYDEDGNWR